MKLLTLSIMLLAFNAHAKKSEAVICEELREKAYDSCITSICEVAEQETGEACVHDGDLHVAASECTSEELPSYIKAYNKKNPTKKVTCEE